MRPSAGALPSRQAEEARLEARAEAAAQAGAEGGDAARLVAVDQQGVVGVAWGAPAEGTSASAHAQIGCLRVHPWRRFVVHVVGHIAQNGRGLASHSLPSLGGTLGRKSSLERGVPAFRPRRRREGETAKRAFGVLILCSYGTVSRCAYSYQLCVPGLFGRTCTGSTVSTPPTSQFTRDRTRHAEMLFT